uniref:Ribosyldihydronicotinamide dehydrogenase [quinone] n=1 Tax=Anolis carolinensis TaxID=28377 RepID=A0A803TM22_ANOCA
MLHSAKDNTDLLTSAVVYSIPCSCGQVYIGTNKCSIAQTRIKEHESNLDIKDFCHIFSTGELYNPEQLNYGVEAFEAYKNGCLSEDLKEEHRKVTEAELVIFQFPLYWYSMPAILKGWMDRVLVQGFAFNIPKGSGSGLLKNKKALLSFTTGGNQAMYTKEGISGDISYVLWPMQFGILQFCGFDVLAPQICFAPEYAPLEERRQMLTSWEKRLKTIWEEKPIPCILA